MCGADHLQLQQKPHGLGSSPRVRSRLALIVFLAIAVRIISACAEQTHRNVRRQWVYGDHLRVCGADCKPCVVRPSIWGSSPRVRSRPDNLARMRRWSGIISACAEQTTFFSAQSGQMWDHLRVCGADHVGKILRTSTPGSSPRVRSRRR